MRRASVIVFLGLLLAGCVTISAGPVSDTDEPVLVAVSMAAAEPPEELECMADCLVSETGETCLALCF